MAYKEVQVLHKYCYFPCLINSMFLWQMQLNILSVRPAAHRVSSLSPRPCINRPSAAYVRLGKSVSYKLLCLILFTLLLNSCLFGSNLPFGNLFSKPPFFVLRFGWEIKFHAHRNSEYRFNLYFRWEN
jgi:hypothetical protein